MNISYVGEGKVYLIAGGGKVYTDMAAKFCRSEKSVEEIIASPTNKKLIESIIKSNHKAALEFDWFLFGIEGYSRVTETQLVRKRHASYMIKSGRAEMNGKRAYNVVLPADSKLNLPLGSANIDPARISVSNDRTGQLFDLVDIIGSISRDPHTVRVSLNNMEILEVLEGFYNSALRHGVKEEDARYFKPQGTEFRAAVGMSAAGLRDWFCIRTCNRAQAEIRDLASKMLKLAREAAPDLFVGAGPSCVQLGFCPEMEQCKERKGKVPTMEQYRKLRKDPEKFKKFMELLNEE